MAPNKFSGATTGRWAGGMAVREVSPAAAQLVDELCRASWERAYLAQAWRLLGAPVADIDYMPAVLQEPTQALARAAHRDAKVLASCTYKR